MPHDEGSAVLGAAETPWLKPGLTLDNVIEMIPEAMRRSRTYPVAAWLSPIVPTRPSREFMIQQAVLNWLQHFVPATVDAYGVVYALHYIAPLWKNGLNIVMDFGVKAEFRKLVAKYG